jgi:hypothetical protein
MLCFKERLISIYQLMGKNGAIIGTTNPIRSQANCQVQHRSISEIMALVGCRKAYYWFTKTAHLRSSTERQVGEFNF